MPADERKIVQLVIRYEQRLTKLRAALAELEEWKVLADDDKLAQKMAEQPTQPSLEG